ncbi:sigma-70 family RNA polymerase sigma factor [Inquilinus sp. CA228]|uniref:sigma-70 family RNA polymerase sigma factor n=1 Tax=Inquilinus sp. CA228 TaxID=3455609 RepID=UPI003F8D1666
MSGIRDGGRPAAEGFDYPGALRRCASGDRTALRAIYERDAGIMLAIARRILRRRDLAEEAVHDAFVQIWRNAARFDAARGAGRAWIITIVRNRALTILRDGRREDLSRDPQSPDLADGAPDPEAIVERLSESGRLRRCLETLEPQRRTGILLAYAHGLTHGEIAARLEVPLGTAKSWIRRALLSLKECMQ